MTIGIAGAGRVAQAMGRHLREAGQPVRAVASRSINHAQIAADFIGGDCVAVPLGQLSGERIVIAVPDRAVCEVAGVVPRSGIMLHTCGVHGAELLNPQRALGIQCGSVHPFQTFATPEAGYRVLPGSAFAVDGDPEALAWAEDIAGILKGAILRIPAESRAIYHAAAAMASNHLIALLDASSELLRLSGVPESDLLQALAPITHATLANGLEKGPDDALTGPIERGDTGTVRAHLTAIRLAPRTVQEFYRAASLQALEIAVRRGLEPRQAQTMHALLKC